MAFLISIIGEPGAVLVVNGDNFFWKLTDGAGYNRSCFSFRLSMLNLALLTTVIAILCVTPSWTDTIAIDGVSCFATPVNAGAIFSDGIFACQPPLNLVLILLGRIIVFLVTFSFDSGVIAIDGVYVYQRQLNLAEVQPLMMTIFLFGSGASAIDGVSVYKP